MHISNHRTTKMKKLCAILLLIAMTTVLAVPAFAADITIESSTSISTYAAERSYNGYKLLNLTTSEENGNTRYAYTINEKYRSVLQDQVFSTAGDAFWSSNKPENATDVTDAQILSYLSTLTSDRNGNPGTLRDFADILYREIQSDSISADETNNNGIFNNVAQGYWLIADVTDLEDSEEANSLVIVDTKGQESITVAPKTDVPTVEKKVQEKNDSTGITSGWQDGADYDIGDDVPFQLTGTLPSNLASYETYKYVFHDTLSKGLTLNPDSIIVKIGEQTLTLDTDYTVKTTGLSDNCSFEIVINDILGINNVTVDKNSSVVVEYTAKLNTGAAIGSAGNPNEVFLEFSNNPYGDGTGETPEDKVIVFTFQLDVNKIDSDKQPVQGAGFTLYKYNSTTQNYEAVGEEIKGTKLTTFTWKGLDSGKYKLVETTVPDGYNKADDILFTIEATYDTNAADPKLSSLVVKDADGKVISGENLIFTATTSSGTVATDVVNTTGIELPETGGMGTTLFYIVGSALVIGAGVLLITKRRMNASHHNH